MVLNRFDQAPTLDVVPDTADGAWHFYDSQILTFTATLRVPGGVADGKTICFRRIGDASGDPAQDFLAYPSGADQKDITYDEKLNAYNVVAHSTEDKSVACAVIVALYLPLPSESTPRFRVEADAPCKLVFESAYTCGKTSPNLLNELNTFQLLPASNAEETPSTCQGNYFRWQGYVVSDKNDTNPGAPLKNICVRLSATADHSFTGVRFFSAYDSAEALVVAPKDNGYGPYVDLVTAEDGVASVFVCAKNTSGTYAGTLRAETGVVGQAVFNYVLPDFLQGVNTRLQEPYVDSPLKLNPDGGESLQCLIPSYDGAASGDHLFLLCNRRMQQVDGSSVMRENTDSVAMSFSKFGLHNIAYSGDHNQLAYVVLPSREPAQLSRSFGFLVDGDPGHVTLDDVGVAPAPKLVSGLAPNGLVMNVASTVDGMTVVVPVGKQNNPSVSWGADQGFELSVTATLAGWMNTGEELEVERLTSAVGREITPAEIAAGYANVWFPRIFLWGLGQSPTGSMGRCSIQYRITLIPSRASVLSEILVSHIDTLPPTGVGEYFETN